MDWDGGRKMYWGKRGGESQVDGSRKGRMERQCENKVCRPGWGKMRPMVEMGERKNYFLWFSLFHKVSNIINRGADITSLILYYLYLFIYFWLQWVAVAAHRLSLVVACGATLWLWCAGFSLQWLLLRQVGSILVAHELSSIMACGIFLDQGLNTYSLHWQGDS